MVDHIRTLLLNPDDKSGYSFVRDEETDRAVSLFGIHGVSPEDDEIVVDRILPLALSPDLVSFRSRFDKRTTPRTRGSVYRTEDDELSPSGLYETVLGREGRFVLSGLFRSEDPGEQESLSELRSAAFCKDAPYALGAVLIACALRRLIRQEKGKVSNG